MVPIEKTGVVGEQSSFIYGVAMKLQQFICSMFDIGGLLHTVKVIIPLALLIAAYLFVDSVSQYANVECCNTWNVPVFFWWVCT